MSSRTRIVAISLALGLVVAACTGGATDTGGPGPGTTASPAPSAEATPQPTPEPVALTVGLGYIPSVQFAHFYLADQRGYYAEAGLTVTFEHRIDPDLIALVGQGAVHVGIADGTSVIPAVSQGIPVRYIATIYGRFPSIVFAKQTSGIQTAADLKGRSLGLPGRYGATWTMLQALLGSADLTPEDLEIVEYPDFGQGGALAQDAVDAATGFANNEPVQSELNGVPVNVLRVDDIVPLPGPGLITGVATLDTKRDAITAFVAATLRAMKDIAANPEVGLDAAIVAVPELGAARDVQAAILDATIEVWTGPVQAARGLGAIEPADWQASIDYLTTLGLVPNAISADDVIDTSVLPVTP
ncbi:MAG: ABC transporter substrate-binding protein [Chloroflexota bacterium]